MRARIAREEISGRRGKPGWKAFEPLAPARCSSRRERGMKTWRTWRRAVWGLCLTAVGCQTDLDLVGYPKASMPEEKGIAKKYTEEPRDLARRPWRAEQSPMAPAELPGVITRVSMRERPGQ